MIISNLHIDRLCPYDGCLYFTVNGLNYSLSPWSMGLECSVQDSSGKWFPLQYDSGFQLLHDMEQSQISSFILDQFIEDIPADIRTVAVQFSHLQHTILRLMKNTRHAVDLAESNPTLLWLIAGKVASRQFTNNEGAKLVSGKQSIALSRLFPGSSILKVGFVKRIQTIDCNDNEFRLVNFLLKADSLVNSLRHCKRIRLDVLSCFKSQEPRIFNIPLIKRLIAGESEEPHSCEEIQIMIHRALRIASEIQHGNPIEALSRCSSSRHLSALHDRWEHEYSRLHTKSMLHKFSKASLLEQIPPIARGTKQIKPITSLRELYTEGQEMHHCVFQGYAEEVYAGNVSVYQVLAPKRGTLALAHEDSEYVIEEFKLAANDDPPSKAWDTVRAWVRSLNDTPKR